MKNKHILGLLFLYLGISATLFGQTFNENSILGRLDAESINPDLWKNFHNNSVEGTPYLNENCQLGEIWIVSGGKEKGILVKYDAYNDDLHICKDESVLALPSTYILGFSYFDKLDNRQVTFQKLHHEGKEKYFIELYKGVNVSLYKRLTKEIVSPSVPESSYTSSDLQKDKLMIKEGYYIRNESENSLVIIKNKKKGVMNFFYENKKLAAYMKSNKLNPSEDEDFIEIVNFVDSL